MYDSIFFFLSSLAITLVLTKWYDAGRLLLLIVAIVDLLVNTFGSLDLVRAFLAVFVVLSIGLEMHSKKKKIISINTRLWGGAFFVLMGILIFLPPVGMPYFLIAGIIIFFYGMYLLLKKHSQRG